MFSPLQDMAWTPSGWMKSVPTNTERTLHGSYASFQAAWGISPTRPMPLCTAGSRSLTLSLPCVRLYRSEHVAASSILLICSQHQSDRGFLTFSVKSPCSLSLPNNQKENLQRLRRLSGSPAAVTNVVSNSLAFMPCARTSGRATQNKALL